MDAHKRRKVRNIFDAIIWNAPELEEVCQDLKKENNTLKRNCESYEKANKTILCIYHEDSKKMEDLQKLNNRLVKSCKKANRDFFILAAAYVATLMLMIYLFIR